ncbi:class I SAM-dependent methyltransferase [Paludisphaera rhizosphaerae]|uniref:class I SAM-dependent methyltransferase n=1 Tax=Paludisphaera rhizosphaerae TaxID=2711216 RepID=UPI0013EE17A1|nr:class I SAM-dependent methyltransferase [Paludisphaera rhizosphaerae]
MSFYATLRSTVRRVIPENIRRAADDPSSKLHSVLSPLKRLVQKLETHDSIYDRKYYEEAMGVYALRSAPIIAKSIHEVFHPSKVVDVGCGTGQLLAELKTYGIPGVGFEYSTAALEIAREKGVEVHSLNLRLPFSQLTKARADLVASTEVAEHLPESCADNYVDYLCSIADIVLMTAAPPGQGGEDHINEQPRSYWIEKFAARGFVYDDEISRKLCDEWLTTNIDKFYATNLMIYRKAAPTA